MAKKQTYTVDPARRTREIKLPAQMRATITNKEDDVFLRHASGAMDAGLKELIELNVKNATEKVYQAWKEADNKRNHQKQDSGDMVKKMYTPDQLAQETIQRAECTFGIDTFIPALVDALNERTFNEIKYHANAQAANAERLDVVLKSAEVMRQSFKRIFGN